MIISKAKKYAKKYCSHSYHAVGVYLFLVGRDIQKGVLGVGFYDAIICN